MFAIYAMGILLCFVLVLPISFKVNSLALGLLCDCTCARETILENIGKLFFKSIMVLWYTQMTTYNKTEWVVYVICCT